MINLTLKNIDSVKKAFDIGDRGSFTGFGYDMTIIERREREKRERSNAIIDAAEEVFFTQGFEHATMLAVSQKAELSKGTLYLYFKNKNELCHAITLRSLKLIRTRFENILDLKCNSLDKIRELPEVYIDFSQQQPDYFRAIQKFRNEMHQQSFSAEFYRKCIRENEKIVTIIEQIIRTGIQDGSIRKDIDPELFAGLIWGNSTGVLLAVNLNKTIAYTRKDRRSAATGVRYLFELFRTALQN